MVTLVCPTGTESYLEAVTDGLMRAQVELWELPQAVAALYHLGSLEGQTGLIDQLKVQLNQAQADADRYYAIACRGTFAPPLKPQGLTFAELCRERGQHDLAEQVEAQTRLMSGGLL